MGATDDLILSHLVKSREDNFGEPDALMKAMNKSGLVQKEVQVKGKNGQIFTRKQWVKAGEDQPVQKPAGKPDEKAKKSKSTNLFGLDSDKMRLILRSALKRNDVPMGTVVSGGGYSYKKVKGTNVNEWVSTDTGKSYGTGEIADLLIGFRDSKISVDMSDEVGTEKNQPAGKQDDKTAGKQNQDDSKDTKSSNKSNAKNIYDVLYEDMERYDDEGKSDEYDGFDLGDGNVLVPHSGGKILIGPKDASDFFSVAKEISPEKASQLYNNAQNSQNSKSDKQVSDKDKSNMSSFKTPSSKQDLIKLLQSGASREDIMAQAEKEGITWKKSDHAGINWMRASMAMTNTSTRGSKGEADSAPKDESKSDTIPKSSKTDIKQFTDKIEQYKKDYDEDSYADAWYEDSFDKTQEMYDNDEITMDEMFEIRQNLAKERKNLSQQKNTKSVIGTDYTKLTTDDESGTIEGEAHNMIVGALGGKKKNPSDLDVRIASGNLAKQYVKSSLMYNNDKNNKLANRFIELSGDTRENIVKDIAMDKNATKESRAQATKELLGKDYRVTPGNTIATSADVGGKYEAEVKIEPLNDGHFRAEFIYADGASRKDTYDSIDSVKEASDKFIKKEKEYNNKK